MQRKVFLDCGANNGCSVLLFHKIHVNDYKEWEVHCFEPNPSFERQLSELTTNVHIKAIHVHDNGVEFDGWSSARPVNPADSRYSFVQSVDLSSWIQSNFSKDDYIILKMDVEGVEYEVIDKMYRDGTLEYIDEIYGELHSLKVGKPIEADATLIRQLDEYGLKMYLWDALEANELSDNYYTMEFLEKNIYPSWRKRGF